MSNSWVVGKGDFERKVFRIRKTQLEVGVNTGYFIIRVFVPSGGEVLMRSFSGGSEMV